jgi:hypothetical protein
MIRRNRPWTPEEDGRLRALLEGGASKTLITAKLNRTLSAIRSRASILRLSFTQIKLKLKAKK